MSDQLGSRAYLRTSKGAHMKSRLALVSETARRAEPVPPVTSKISPIDALIKVFCSTVTSDGMAIFKLSPKERFFCPRQCVYLRQRKADAVAHKSAA